MSQKKNLIQIATQLASITGCTQATAESFLKSLFSLLADLIQQGKKVKIKGIGTFKKGDNNDNLIIYEPDKQLSAIVNLPFSSFEPVELDDDVNDDVFNKELNNSSETSIESNINISQEPLKIADSNDIEIKQDSDETTSELDLNQSDENAKLEADNNSILKKVAIEDNSSESTELQSTTENTPNKDEEDIIDDKNEDNVAEEFNQKNEKIKIGIPIYILSIIFALILGFGCGYFYKSIKDNNIINQRIDNQQKQLDSIQSAINNEQKDTVIVQPKDTIKYDTVKINRYITNMAKEYYGDTNFWSYIYEENKEQLGHPERIYPGTVVKIPTASKYGIDATDPASVQRAKVKAIEIYAKFRK